MFLISVIFCLSAVLSCPLLQSWLISLLPIFVLLLLLLLPFLLLVPIHLVLVFSRSSGGSSQGSQESLALESWGRWCAT